MVASLVPGKTSRKARGMSIKQSNTPKTGAHGWPLVPSTRFKGETALACPKCGSTNVTLDTARGASGTAPGGRWRMGDPGSREYARCESCKHSSLDAK
jgi:predicted RNA-binding Zn-ribbon protein involved in translation (DUF1610 family)